MEKKTCIIIKGAALGYKKSGQALPVLKGLNLTFDRGDFVGIVGLNGVGKSTLLKSICGILPLLQGDILLDGLSVTKQDLHELAKKIAIVLTERIGGFNLKAFDVVAAGQIPYTDSFHRLREEHLTVIHSAINSCGLNEHSHKLVNELSDGLFQKTIIAKALAQQTPVMLLDEPSAFLDYASKHELFILLRDLCASQNKCVLVSSHDLDLLVKYCNKLLIVSEGSAELVSAEEAVSNEKFKKIGGGFLG